MKENALQLTWPEPGIALLTLNRPGALNALTDEMVERLHALLAELADDSRLRVLVVTGAGRGFCAGFDLSQAAKAPTQDDLGAAAAWTARQERFAGLVTRMRALRAPVIAAVNGLANGGGLALALGCEVRYAAASARFNAAFLKVGMTACDMGVSWLLPRAVGLSRSFEILLTGRMVDAAEAERIGLVTATVPDEALLPRALDTARQIVAHDAFGVWMTKRGGWANAEAPSLAQAIELENRSQILAQSTGSLQRAAEAFIARKRSKA
ncbi:MAG: enoyl-CoA hydratase/isomerase family protein [Rubrivivax sp.]|jgi:enoyl-CoA hydratase|nr:enoyl-CoA hydratase/isomerase family protein [Rubrivivax sp.]MCL4696365.1 enoyl-CoA hydratase/isomerase family protein [Burkholderiaceae bacterium]